MVRAPGSQRLSPRRRNWPTRFTDKDTAHRKDYDTAWDLAESGVRGHSCGLGPQPALLPQFLLG